MSKLAGAFGLARNLLAVFGEDLSNGGLAGERGKSAVRLSVHDQPVAVSEV